MYNKGMDKNYALPITFFAFAVVVAGIILLTMTYYTNESYLVLRGESEITIGLNGVYDEPGAEAVLGGRDAGSRLKISGKVRADTPGTYTIKYKAGHFTTEREVTVLEEMDPVIELQGGPVTMKLGDTYTEPGYTARDAQGNDLTSEVKVTGADFSRAGVSKIRYTVTDGEGKMTRLTRRVRIEPNTRYETSGIPICMYHYVYDESNIPETVNANYISAEDLSEELEFLKAQDFYFPTWQEVRDYVDGKLLLPEKSIVLTFDDGSYKFLDNGIPVLEKYGTPATCFVITSKHGEKKVAEYRSEYVDYQSHSHNMHRGGGRIGHGGIMTVIGHDEGLADLRTSIGIVGSSEALAYPFGDTNESARQIAEDAGFICAVTTQPGRARPGDDPLLLPRQRMSRNQSLETFRDMVMPFDNSSK